MRQARNLWDSWGECFVLNDGASPRLIFGRIGSTSLDTVDVEVPLRDPDLGDEAETARISGIAKPPEPTLLWRIRRLVISPDGWIWLQPVQPKGLSGVEVFRFNPRLGSGSLDTVPVFPMEFGAPGEYFAMAGTRSTGYRLQRVRMSSDVPTGQ
jgi:hypothetical protein